VQWPRRHNERHRKVITDQMPYYPASFESWGALVHNGNIELLPLDTTHRRFNRHTFVNLETLRFERLGVPGKGFDVLVENQYLPRIGKLADFLGHLSDFLSHRSPSNFRGRELFNAHSATRPTA